MQSFVNVVASKETGSTQTEVTPQGSTMLSRTNLVVTQKKTTKKHKGSRAIGVTVVIRALRRAIILPANCDDELIHLLLIEAIMLPVMVLHLLLHVFDETSPTLCRHILKALLHKFLHF